MKVIFEPLNNNSLTFKNTAIGLGNFDGLHIGHSALINALIKECSSRNLTSIIYTFMKHPENILRKKLFTPQITTTKKKIELLKKFNIDFLYFAQFNESFSRMPPEKFIKKVLIDTFGIKLAIVGYDYKFGFEGTGDIALLEHYSKKYNFDIIVIPPVYLETNIVSSTLIRQSLARGSIDKASEMLGRPYSIQGMVVKGRNFGWKIGFPTANILPEKYLIIPRSGVYITKTYVKGKLYNSVTNIGKNPTFKLKGLSVETHILNFNENIYNEIVEVFFYSRIRGEKKFKDIESLTNQINADISIAKDYHQKIKDF